MEPTLSSPHPEARFQLLFPDNGLIMSAYSPRRARNPAFRKTAKTTGRSAEQSALSALSEKNKTMTDTHTSGADSAPGAGPSQTVGQAPAGSAETGAFGAFQQTGAFGSARGSGLARGKRTSTPAATAASVSKSDGYKPTALEVIVPQREYKNPFTGETSASPQMEVPAQTEPSAREYITPQASPAPALDRPVPAEPAIVEKVDEEGATQKPEITILPPAQKPQPALSWESGPSSAGQPQAPLFPLNPRRDDRQDDRSGGRGESRRDQRTDSGQKPDYSAQRRDGREHRSDFRGQRSDNRDSRPDGRGQPSERTGQAPENRGQASERGGLTSERGGLTSERGGLAPDNREPRRDREPFRDRERSREFVREEAPLKPVGFFGWLKSLFSGKPAAQPQPQRAEGERTHDGQHHRRRRRRGGRGRQNSEYRGGGSFNAERGPGESSSQEGGQQRHSGGESRGDFQGGEHRRRRGGRGRYRDDRGGPRSEGQQGGGAI